MIKDFYLKYPYNNCHFERHPIIKRQSPVFLSFSISNCSLRSPAALLSVICYRRQALLFLSNIQQRYFTQRNLPRQKKTGNVSV